MAGNLVRIAMWTPLLVGACSFSAATGDNVDARKIDAARADAPIDASPGCNTLTCSGNTLTCETKQEVCAVSCSTTGGAHCTQFTPSNGAQWTDLATIADGTGDLNVTEDILINSDTGTITTRLNPTVIRSTGEGVNNGYRFRAISEKVSLLAFDDLTIPVGAKVRVTGNRALIILARNTITIAGEIDADGGRPADPTQAGPGAGAGAVGATPAGGCGFGLNGQFDSTNQHAGGGAGGSFGGKGGDGGDNLGGIAANVCTDLLTLKLQGGSGGGRGGNPNDSGNGGGGGGAIQFTAGVSLSVSGLLHAGGAGGQSSLIKGGGGGAGAGGGFLFEAPAVNVLATAIIVTNGGGGGDGKNDVTDGETGRPDLNVAAKAGNGGDGGVGNSAARNGGGNQNMGSGGGGGGIGKIEIQCVNPSPITSGAKVSPPTPTFTTLVGI